MPTPNNPWSDEPPKNPGIRLAIWLGLIALIGLAVWRLSVLFPGQVTSDLDQAYVIQAIVLIAVISSGFIFARRVNLKETVRNILIWVGIAAVLIIGLSFRDEIESVAMRVR